MAKALYRKYRSKSFDEVVGQEHITDTLKNAIKKGAISHAYLFTGPRGVGKTSIARILAHEINNLPYTDESIHLDIIEIDAASNRRIDEIRDLRDKVHIAPTSAKYKVYIIDEVHMLTREAFNALLKTLEEPPEHVVFILATTEAHKVPETIISRTQRFSFKPISTKKTIEHLREIAESEGLKIDDEALELLAEHGRGSFRDSISMLDQLAGVASDHLSIADARLLLGVPDGEIISQAVTALENNDSSAIFDVVAKLREQGVDSGRAAGAISEKLRSNLIDGTLNISQTRVVTLLKNLLPLTLGSNDFVGLELALLDAIDLDDSHEQPRETEKPAKTVKIPEVKDKDEPKAEKPKPEAVKIVATKESEAEMPKLEKPKPSKNASADVKGWNELLDSLKKQHNTLYGVLRMAQPTFDDNGLLLEFNFDFHRKQVELGKNSAILKQFMKEYLGDISYVCKTKPADKAGKKVEKAVDNTPDTAVVSTIANVFGGAELVES